ncbi:PEPxxWA-CTERM sorting domain-containing protein [Sphingomonas sp. MMS24-J13]|uniref:PEPxxWA-CTERM sorting domain-containing protein n=1 Tax=Sphingomonas sp. MMS24-J13 TaxID=3238686 RepID=UPI00385106B3
MQIKRLALIGASFLTLVASAAHAGTVYTNGATDGTASGWTISSGYAVTNAFTLSAAATITGFSFGGWTYPGDAIATVDWGISSAADYAISGTANVTEGVGGQNGYGYSVHDYSASIAPLSLSAGTYYFALQNATTTAGNNAYWDINNGPSIAYENMLGNTANYLFPGTNSAAFTLQSGGAVPEPASWAMMIGGFGMVGATLRRRQRTTVRFA